MSMEVRLYRKDQDEPSQEFTLNGPHELVEEQLAEMLADPLFDWVHRCEKFDSDGLPIR